MISEQLDGGRQTGEEVKGHIEREGVREVRTQGREGGRVGGNMAPG